MATTFNTPGVYVVEQSTFPPSVAQVETAIPAFIGYTQTATQYKYNDLQLIPTKISSLKDYEALFGYGPSATVTSVAIADDNTVQSVDFSEPFYMYDSLQLFFANGGGNCYIVSIGNYGAAPASTDFTNGLDAVKRKDEPTLLLFPDAVKLGQAGGFYNVQTAALAQAAALQDRFVILDLLNYLLPNVAHDTTNFQKSVDEFRNNIGINNLNYGAAYTPFVYANIPRNFTYADISASIKRYGTISTTLLALSGSLSLADQAVIQPIINDYDKLVTDKATINSLINLQYGTNYNIYSHFNTKLNAFRQQAYVGPTNLTNTFSAFNDLMDEVFMLTDAVDDLNQPGKITNTDLLNAVTSISNALDVALLPLVKLNNTVADKLIGNSEVANYPRQDKITGNFKTQPGTNWYNLKLKAVIAKTDKDDTLFKYTAALDETVDADKPKILENLLWVEKIITDTFNTFYAALNTIYAKVASYISNKEDALRASYPLYRNLITSVNNTPSLLPPSGAIAGSYAYVDSTRGVWKAPANVSLDNVPGVPYEVTDNEQDSLNIDVNAGKSIDVIRPFTGKGTLIWGARTLAGNDNEWRYIPVRRFFIMVEESVKKSTSWAVFESNDANTWVRVKGMIDNFLTLQWRNGALQGAKPDDAFYVRVGLGITMTAIDILQGYMNVEIGMAVVRPAEFIVLKFSHKMAVS